ncbi:hypothetical protein QUF80_15300 [Desulfococcaceae bacterium HSG8]|nr:hypothetical protein [Desulfococcaceae bacterium HSG8]
MYLLINELSFQAQASDRNHAHKLMNELVSVIKSLKSFQENPVCTSETLWKRDISLRYNVFQWLNETSKDQMRWFNIVVRKGPYIETLLDEYLDYYECRFHKEDVSSSSLAGAFFFDGILTSLQHSDLYSSEQICLQCQGEGEPEESEIINVFNADQLPDVIEKLSKRIFQNISSWNDLWTQKALLFPYLSFCECVKEQLGGLDFSPTNVKIIQEHLSKMNEYCGKLAENEKFLPDYQQMGLEATRENKITLKHYGYQREFICPDGKKRIFEWHSKQKGQNLRIHFYPPNDNNKQFLIGYIGPHLDTYKHH